MKCCLVKLRCWQYFSEKLFKCSLETINVKSVDHALGLGASSCRSSESLVQFDIHVGVASVRAAALVLEGNWIKHVLCSDQNHDVVVKPVVEEAPRLVVQLV